MGLESVSHIDDLNASNPVAADPKSEGDDHIRNIKTALLADFPHVNAATPLSPTGFDDTNGNEVIIVGTTASAVNEVTVTNAASGNKPAVTQSGADDVGIDIEGVEVHNGALTASTTNGDLKLTRNGTGDITVDSTPIYGLVILDTPEELVNTTTPASWTTVNSTTLNTAGAVKAILSVRIESSSSNSSTVTYCSLRKTGSGISQLISKACGHRSTVPSGFAYSHVVGEKVVNLDSNSDFDWYWTDTSTSPQLYIYLVGYYV